jgi:hypothetical protein
MALKRIHKVQKYARLGEQFALPRSLGSVLCDFMMRPVLCILALGKNAVVDADFRVSSTLVV